MSAYRFLFMGAVPKRPEEGVGYSGAGVTGSSEPCDVSAKNQTQVLWKSSMHL